jgi:hypothetical protein
MGACRTGLWAGQLLWANSSYEQVKAIGQTLGDLLKGKYGSGMYSTDGRRCVRDQGTGIEPANLDRIFSLFQQSSALEMRNCLLCDTQLTL